MAHFAGIRAARLAGCRPVDPSGRAAPELLRRRPRTGAERGGDCAVYRAAVHLCGRSAGRVAVGPRCLPADPRTAQAVDPAGGAVRHGRRVAVAAALVSAAPLWQFTLWATLAYIGIEFIEVPHSAWTPDLAKSYNDRSLLNTFRTGGIILGTLISFMLIAISRRSLSKFRRWGLGWPSAFRCVSAWA